MREGLGDHPEVLDLIRENTPFSHFLDVECIPPPPLFLWQLIVREAKIKRKGEMWFVFKGVPVRYSLREFSLISGLNCSHLNAGFENSNELTSAKNDFIRAHFPSAKKGKKFAAVTYKMVVQRFLEICKGLDREKKKEGQEMDAVKMAALLFVVVVLLGPTDRDKSAIPDWILGMIAQWTAILGFPWGTWAFMESLGSLRKGLAAKAKSIGRWASSTMYYTGFLLPIGTLKSILVPDKFEATAEWYLNFHPLETTKHPELDAFVAKLECRGEVHIPVERKRKSRNVPSPTRDNSEERNEHISSPQESQRSQSLRESPYRVSHSNIPNPSSPTPHPAKPSSNSFQELFDRMSKKIDNIAEEQRKRTDLFLCKNMKVNVTESGEEPTKNPQEVPEMTIMGDCEETEARNPSPDHKVSPRLGILQIVREIKQEHENQPSTLSDSVLSLENRKAESTHETMGTEDATSMKPLQEMVESSHEVMETDAAASMKPLQADSTHETMGTEDATSMKPMQEMVESSHEVMETDAADSMKPLQAESTHETMGTEDAASMKPLQEMVVSPPKESGDEAEITDAIVYGKRVKKKSASLKSPYTADGRKKKKADELLSKPPTKVDLLEFKSFIIKAIKEDRPVQCYLAQYKEIQGFVKMWWTDLITPGLWLADTYLSEYLYVLRRRLCNDDGDSCIAPFKFFNYVNSYAHDPQWPVLSGPLEKIVDDELRGFKGIAGIREISKHGYADWEIEYCPVPQQIDSDCGIFAVIPSRYHPREERLDIYTRIGCYPVRVVLGDDGKHRFAAENGWRYFLYDHQCQNLWHILFKKLSETAYTAIVISTLGSEVDYPIRIPDYDSDADDVTDDDDDVFVCKLEESHFLESSQKLPLSEEFCEANGFVEGKTDVTLIGPNMQPVVCTLKVDCIGDGFLKRMWRYFVDSNGLRVGDKLVMRPVGNNTFMVGVYRHHRR
ncbi:unnamed protein product [Cuscuta campestris]|uniref:TF-B3 domain-containing protein n=1 Tax=Cuscuta campestris TaxID=132261 RepID=A0A484LI19_9ASTE|nr:unnamed protein product [Cuscuta campestris]